MKIECGACGKVVEARTRFDRCPACGRPVTSVLQNTLLHRPPTDPNPLPPAEDAPRYAPLPPTPSPAAIEKRIAKVVFISIGTIILAVILGDYVRLRFKLLTSAPPAAAPTVAVAPATAPAPVVQAPTPAPPAPAQSIFSPPPRTLPPPPPEAAPASQPAPAPKLVLHPVPLEKTVEQKTQVTDSAIRASIEKGIGFLLEQFDSTGKLISTEGEDTLGGRDALCVQALLHAGLSTQDKRLPISGKTVTQMLEQLKKFKMDANYSTYSRSLRIGALAVHNRRADRETMRNDVGYLMKSSYKASFTYALDPNRQPNAPQGWDNSNTQYGQMGLWLAAESGLIVSNSFWTEVQKHWLECEAPGGGFGYQKGNSGSLAMTAAGLTMMLVADEQLYGESWASTTRPKPAIEMHDAIQRAINWIGKGDNSVSGGEHFGYTLYGLERAGLASGFRFFGKHDWYAELAAQVLRQQAENGSWSGADGPAAETAFALLFLSRGRHPVMMNKLMFDGTWANRPRDAAHLAKFTARELERPLNWAVVGIDNAWETWTDCPILYIASHEAPQFTDEQIDKLRNFAMSGGVILTHADNHTEAFNSAARGLAQKLFPQYKLEPLPENHLLYSIGFPVPEKYPLEAVSNGTRLLMIHSPSDLSTLWQRRDPDAYLAAHRLGANIFIYATGKEAPRQRLESLVIPEPPNKPIGAIPIARIKYAGDWDPEPFAWTRLSRNFMYDTSIALNLDTVELQELSAGNTKLAHLTGISAVNFNDAQLAALRKYVDEGGVLLIDACGGSKPFADSVRAAIINGFTKDPTPLEPTHPILAGKGEGMTDLTRIQLRSFAVPVARVTPPHIDILNSGKGCVIISEYDLTCGWLGTSVWGILGYDPGYAQNFAKNVLLWTVNYR